MSLALMVQKKLTVEKWIQRCMADTDKEGPLTMITLVHYRGAAPEELHTVRFSPGAVFVAKELAEVFDGRAHGYVQELAGTHTFNLFAFFGGRKEPEDRHIIVINVASNSGGLSTEAPTKEGALSQDMRQKEAWMQQVFRKQEFLDNYHLRWSQDLELENRALRQENREAFMVVKDLLMKQVTERHDHRMEEMKYARASDERAKFIAAAPALTNSLLGKNIFPQSTEDTSLVESIAMHFMSTPGADISGLAAGLPPHIQAALMSRMARFAEEKAAAKEANEAARQLNPTPGENDAKGT